MRFREAEHWKWFVLATAWFALALLSKPSAAVLPLLALVLDRGMLGRSWRESAKPFLCWLPLALASVAVAHHAEPVGLFQLFHSTSHVSQRLAAYVAGQPHSRKGRKMIELDSESMNVIVSGYADVRQAKIVAWLREFGNHSPAPNCERCNAADEIESGAWRERDQ